jgi:hypothetical protein
MHLIDALRPYILARLQVVLPEKPSAPLLGTRQGHPYHIRVARIW